MILEEKKRELQSMMLVVDRSQADVAALTGQLEEYVRIETEKTEVDAKLMSNQSHEVQQLIEDEKAIHNENIKRMNQDFEKEKATRASKPRRPKRRFGGIRGTPEVGVRDRIKNALSRVMTPHKTPTTPKTPSSDRAARVRILNNSGRSLLEPSKLKRRSMRHPSKSQGADLFDEGLDSLA
ncbi:MAG: uncharacterized protein KVP18_001643 [Porospora cf. gigantea A]|nr:MAG: hypothetical protein KVP18_001643 [Porospora cf. gigantea A]